MKRERQVRCICVAALMCFAAWTQCAAADPRPVELELVLAVDVSSSVDPKEFALQMSGYAQAFRHRDVVRALAAAGDLGVAVTLVQWSDTNAHRTAVPWALLTDRNSAARFAAAIEAAPRLLVGFTSIGSAIRYSLAQIEQNNYEGQRKVIDISGDGSSTESNPAPERDRAVARGVTINGAVILDEDYWGVAAVDLPTYYDRNVIGGNGAFVVLAQNFHDFATVIRKKLLREITGPGVAALERE